MEPSPDPNRPHDLGELIVHATEQLSWADVCRVRAYVGAPWPRLRERSGSDYSLAAHVLMHLDQVEGARAATAPYVTIACATHDAAIGDPCARGDGMYHHHRDAEEDTGLPTVPFVCTRRVLAKHDRLAATALFEKIPQPLPPPNTHFSRWVFPISGDAGRDVIARAQYRHPLPLFAESLYISHAEGWTVHDVRVGGVSIVAPHFDLPGDLFSNAIVGPHLPLPAVTQDQWIEIEARRVRDDATRLFASVVGRRAEGEMFA